jgi:hypothetical protein
VNARRVEDADAFLSVAGPFLAAHEAEHNLALGLLGRLRVEPRLYGFDPIFILAEDAGDVVGFLLRTPPHGVVLSRFASFEAVDAVAAAIVQVDRELPGAVGPADVVARFARGWSAQTGTRAELAIRQRIHVASMVRDVAPVPGGMREACADDREQIIRWLEAFADEALGTAPHVEDAEASYLRRLADPDGRWLVWDDGGPVSLAAYGPPTPSGTRVGPVYTPPDLRGHGYATALVAALTEERLASGLAFCFLFTDLANPTSNAIYARIGYEPVADWDLWSFG